ncbi:MAG: tRNA (N6-threonylcarbamoyladenosine(37)-N6)-methyltransferase TrmO [Azonexus sp.]|nr:tRNA (N6-threonylcarbamoyladenosine(37)-N6)-methyltransferase TrmO [Azonexus sp.]
MGATQGNRPVMTERHYALIISFFIAALLLMGNANPTHAEMPNQDLHSYSVHPVGWIRKAENRTYIEIDRRYQPALMGVENLKTIWVLYWFDRNDTPEKRATLQVHPRGNPDNPLRGVFATRSPLRPNLIALSQVNIIDIKDNVIEIDAIDAFENTPVLDLKP